MQGNLVLPWVCAMGILFVATAANAAEGMRAASDYGCLNCHQPKSTSPPRLSWLADTAARHGPQSAALQPLLADMREHSGIHTHQMVTDDAALSVLRWLAQGAK